MWIRVRSTSDANVRRSEKIVEMTWRVEEQNRVIDRDVNEGENLGHSDEISFDCMRETFMKHYRVRSLCQIRLGEKSDDEVRSFLEISEGEE